MSGLLDGAKKAYLIVKRHATPTQTTQLAPIQTMRVHTEKVWAVAFFKDGRRIVTPSKDKTLQIWDVETRTLVGGLFKGHSDRVYSVAVSPNDRRFASGGETGAIIIWDVGKKQMLFELKKHVKLVPSLCFSPDGKRLASGSLDKTVIIWDAKTGAVLSTLQSARGSVFCVVFSPNGLQLASGEQGTVRVWNTENVAELLFDINFAHQGWVKSVAWTPDGQQLISASHDQTIKFWDSSNGTKIGQPCTGHTHDINSLAISSDASFIATVSFDKTMRMWSTESHEQIGQRLKHTTRVSSVAISPNGELLVIGDYDGNVQLWSIENILSATLETDSSYYLYLAHRSKVKLGQNLYAEALLDAEKVIELNPTSHLGYELRRAALCGALCYDDALEGLTIMPSELDDVPDPQIRQLRQQYVSPSEVAIRRAIDAKLENAPLRLINTITGDICDRSAQIKTFVKSTKYKMLLHSLVMHAPLQTELIEEAVVTYFSWVMLSHRWEIKEPLLHEIQGSIYDLDPVGTIVKLQKFCEVVRNAGHCWAWSDTCCIDQNNNIELQQSVNSMFIWYRHSALAIVYLSDVPPSSLANSIWNTRGWTVQEFLAPKMVLFYQADWTLYLDDHSHNHKQSVSIMKELEDSTGINARALVNFHPGMRNPREKLQWVSKRETTREEDIAYSLFGIFGVHLPVIYGEKRQNALGRLLQEIIAHSGDITALDWVGQSSGFNSCLPADISSYKAPSLLPSLSEDEMQNSVSTLRNTVAVESALNLYTLLEKLSFPRFANARLQLPCIAFPLTEVRRRSGQYGDQRFTYDVKADGLRDLPITTEDQLAQFWLGRRVRRTVLLIRPWTRYLLGLSDFAELLDFAEPPDINDECSVQDYWSALESPGEQPECERAFRLVAHLGKPFSAFLLVQQPGGEYRRIASDISIIAQVRDASSIDDLMDIRTLEIL
ncbi:WD40-repeat-containing domain protein [Suillus subaureus]|uniref:WD40-repeat-containing domain protein n=1 Tax=Suillus subaureus TaxID=48587 RepID=A0A9P7ED10_9AGAM|nr:WD40-repeat-containing domain protein [Suillus subaureus]KAG1817625.1 WD40-repeat-containing domain protein [Suillus subaureus]